MGRSALAAAAAAADAAAVAAEKSRHAAEVADVIAKALGDTPNANVYALESAAASCDAAADRAAAAAAALLFEDESVAFGSIVTDTVASTGSSLMRSADRARRAGKSRVLQDSGAKRRGSSNPERSSLNGDRRSERSSLNGDRRSCLRL